MNNYPPGVNDIPDDEQLPCGCKNVCTCYVEDAEDEWWMERMREEME